METAGKESQRAGEPREKEESPGKLENLYRAIFEATGNATVIVEEDTTISLVNGEFEKLSGFSREETEGKKSWLEFFAAEHLEKMLEYHRLRRIDPGIVPRNYESRFIRRNGGVKDVSVTVSVIPGSGKSVASFTDITRLKQAEDVLKRYQLLSEHARDIILFMRPDGRIIEANGAAVAAYGYTRRELLSLRIHDLRGDCDGDLLAAQMREAEERGILFETVHRRKDGSVFPVEVSSRGAVIGGERLLLSVIRDITDRKQVEEQLRHLTTHDSLTGIPNRRSLEEALRRAVMKAGRVGRSALLFLDLDNFKMVNDTLGHAAGDELLVALVDVLKGNLREGDFLARLGGDEFAVLLERTTTGEAGVMAEKLRRAVEKSEQCFITHESFCNLTVSIGIVMVDGTLSPRELMSLADSALYAAKENGRNRFVFAGSGENDTAGFSQKNKLAGLIKRAAREGRFRLFYQPVYGVRDGRVEYYEALVRLLDIDGGEIPPSGFIPVAERFGLMPRVDCHVVRLALETLGKYRDLALFVNISGVTLGDDAALAYIEEIIRGNGVEPVRLGFEITESAAVKDLPRARRWVGKLKGLGCRFALDDFGTGFSSFSYLRALPVDFLKIDGSYVRDLDADPTRRALVQAMNAVAHILGKRTVAEFVENENVLKILREMRIDYGQGYYLGRPAPLF